VAATLEQIGIQGSSGASTVIVGGQAAMVADLVPAGARVFCVTDENVARLHGASLPSWPRLLMGQGEGCKTMETILDLFRSLLAQEADRGIFLVGVGGGIVCDVTGFLASTFMRGVRFGFVSTTLLAQVDASVGGKNGVNVDGYKNIMGNFNQPEFVLCPTDALATLPKAELGCGLAEILKHILIADAAMLPYLEEHADDALAADPDVLRELVAHSVRIKAGVVNRDERESGERRKLNFGHTLGHAVEKLQGVPHGHAVGIGTALAVRLSARRGYLGQADVARVESLLEQLGLPTRPSVGVDEIIATMRHDKKRAGERIHFVFLAELGRAVVESLPLAELEAEVRAVLAEM
jgi:3-dehydroquinate synthase